VQGLCGSILIAVLATMPAGSSPAGQAPSQPGRDFAAGGSPEELLQHPDVQKELKLSSQQDQKINQIRRAVHKKHQEEFERLPDLGPEERRRKQAVLAKTVSQEITRALSHVLGPEQATRLEQIHLQQQGLRAFSDPKVDKALRLTDDQKENIKLISEEAAKEARRLFRAGAESSFQETLKKVEKVRRKAIEKCIALLTDEQRKAWRELIGEPFELKSEPPLIRQPDREPNQPKDSKKGANPFEERGTAPF
jgi:hypothetical protein